MGYYVGESLNQLAAQGDLERIKAAIESGVAISENDNSALRFAVIGGHLPVVRLLLEAGAKSDGRMLRAALRLQKHAVISYLLEHGVPLQEAWDGSLQNLAGIDSESLARLIKAGLPLKDLVAESSIDRPIDSIAYDALLSFDINGFLYAIALGADPVLVAEWSLEYLFQRTYPNLEVGLKERLSAANMAFSLSRLPEIELDEIESRLEAKYQKLSDADAFRYGCSCCLNEFRLWRSGKFDNMSDEELVEYWNNR